MWRWVASYRNALKRTIQVLEEIGVTYMLFGKPAVGYYGFAQPTNEIDVMLEITPQQAQRLVSHAKKAGFRINKKIAFMLIKAGNFFPAEFDNQMINFWLAKWRLERKMLLSRRRVFISGKQAWMCSPENIILYMLRRGGDINYDDILGILIRQGNKLKAKAIMNRVNELVTIHEDSSELSAKLSELVEKAMRYRT